MSIEFPNPAWSGTTSIAVLDNSGGPANILDLNEPWKVKVTLDVTDPSATLAGTFDVHLFAESFGPGPEPHLGDEQVVILPGTRSYDVVFTMPANTPVFGGPPAISSFYKLAAVVEHRNTLGNETVIAGVVEGPAIHLRNP